MSERTREESRQHPKQKAGPPPNPTVAAWIAGELPPVLWFDHVESETGVRPLAIAATLRVAPAFTARTHRNTFDGTRSNGKNWSRSSGRNGPRAVSFSVSAGCDDQ